MVSSHTQWLCRFDGLFISLKFYVTNDFPIFNKAFLILLLIFQLAYPTKNVFLVKLTHLEILGKNNYINIATNFMIAFKLAYLMLVSVTLLLSQPQQNDSKL